MMTTVKSGQRSGSVKVPASKSVVHRMLICSALSNARVTVGAEHISKDIEATVACLAGMGAEIKVTPGRIDILSGLTKGGECFVNCGESGSTLRFLIPVAAALGKTVHFKMEGLLSKRPHDVLTNELMRHGAVILQTGDVLNVSGQIKPGKYEIPGNISSQFISGLLFALPLLNGDSDIIITGKRESVSYINMTLDALEESGVRIEETKDGYFVPGKARFCRSGFCEAERDWSGAAFFMCMGAMSDDGITLENMNVSSHQGDMKVMKILKDFGAEINIVSAGSGNDIKNDKLRMPENDSEAMGAKEKAFADISVKKGKCLPCEIDASDIPDLVPVLSVLMCAAEGKSVIKNAQRLRLKESDRLETTSGMIRALGGDVRVTEDGLEILGTGSLKGGTVDAANDHRIAMSAATAASICTGEVIIPGSQCADKSYPGFFDDLESLKK
ncbi:MAG: 3-phosphoshikimate 1-carboxyvinyltransferase [Lachnospiraceae bacterium]|nr:3-phosphoshikimate 1-carboxyvinyltransferase [Lachnospiraceae bacterium]